MVVDEIRRENARMLVEQECAGSRAEFGRRIGRGDNQVNHLIGPNPSKNIGPKIARLIESKFDKPRGWLDVRHIDELPTEAIEVGMVYAKLSPTRKLVVRELLASWEATSSTQHRPGEADESKVEHATEGS